MRRRQRHANPRIPCGVVGPSKNKYVGGAVQYRGAVRRVVGCASVGSDRRYYATRLFDAAEGDTKYIPVKKRALRDLNHMHKNRVLLQSRISGNQRTSAKLVKAWERRYAKLAGQAVSAERLAAQAAHGVAAPTRRGRRWTAAEKLAFKERMAAGKAAAARGRAPAKPRKPRSVRAATAATVTATAQRRAIRLARTSRPSLLARRRAAGSKLLAFTADRAARRRAAELLTTLPTMRALPSRAGRAKKGPMTRAEKAAFKASMQAGKAAKRGGVSSRFLLPPAGGSSFGT